MAFNVLDPTLIEVGKPTKKEIFENFKDNQDDLDSRLGTQEQGAGKIVVYNDLVINSTSSLTLTGLDVFRAQSDFTLIDAKVGIFEVGSLTGILEMDIKRNSSLDPVGFSSVFTTEPSVDFGTASDYDESSNAVFDAGQISVTEGTYLRLDITSLPSPIISKFYVFVIGELA